MQTKICSQCEDDLPIESFSLRSDSKDGRNTRCRGCAALNYQENKASRKKKHLAWLEKNKEKRRKYLRKHYVETYPKERLKRQTKEHKARRVYLQKIRLQKPRNKLNNIMGVGIWKALKAKKAGRKWEKLAGYTVEELIQHLESLFEPGMTWDNHGSGWHIDHIKPRSSFEIDSAECDAFKECWSLSNLQPLWAEDNMRKGARV